MQDHVLDQYPDNNARASFNILLRMGLVSESERPRFAEYAEPDEYCFVCRLRAYGYAIWHAPTRTRVFVREWGFFRNKIYYSEEIELCSHNRIPYKTNPRKHPTETHPLITIHSP